MSERTRLARQTPVSECVALLAIEPLLVATTDDLLTVMRRSTAQPQTRVIGVVEPDTGRLAGVLPILRVAEGVVARVVPESLMTNLADLEKIGEFGHRVDERTAGEAMQQPAIVSPDATLTEAFRMMHERRLSGLYVVDAEGRPTDYLDMLELVIRFVDALAAEEAAAEGPAAPAAEPRAPESKAETPGTPGTPDTDA
jgi:CBS domain-containing protein